MAARRGNPLRGADLDDGRAAGRVRNQRDARRGRSWWRRRGGVGRGRGIGRGGVGRRGRWGGRVCFVIASRRLAAWQSRAARQALVTLPWIATALRASR